MNLIYVAVFFVFLLFLGFEAYVYYFRPRQLRRRLNEALRYHPAWKHIKRTERLFNELYRHVRGKAISTLARKLWGLQRSDEFIYGEIEFLSFFLLLEKTAPQSGQVFYDLGSGSGKAVFAAALGFDFSKACGVELLPALYQKAGSQQLKCKNMLLRQPKAFSEVYLKKLAAVEFIQASFLETDFSDADRIYVAATCLREETWQALVACFADLKPGSQVLVATKVLEHPAFELLRTSTEVMSWGLCTVRVYRRMALEAAPL